MEIQELISYYLYEEKNLVEISFRLSTDTEDEIRNDFINLNEAKDFGYDLTQNNFDFFDLEDEDEDEFDFQTIDEDVLISFLNEYYIINPKKLPKVELL